MASDVIGIGTLKRLGELAIVAPTELYGLIDSSLDEQPGAVPIAAGAAASIMGRVRSLSQASEVNRGSTGR